MGGVSTVHIHEEIPRSEGDLRIYWDERDGLIDEAWCQGTMYRGYEMILIGRHPEDALATTARLCGICSTSHVVAATDALENAWNIVPPPQAVRLRNLFLAAESLMSDARQGALFFGPGLCDPSFADHDLYDEIVQAFQSPFVGWLPRQVMTFSKRILGVITAFTQQWPHSIPFRPGGTSCPVGRRRSARRELPWTITRTGMPRPSSAAASTTGHRSPPPSSSGSGSNNARTVSSASTPATPRRRPGCIGSVAAATTCSAAGSTGTRRRRPTH